MIRSLRETYRRMRPILSPSGLIARAAILWLAFGIAHATGMRSFTSILCGMASASSASDGLASVLGLVYILAFLGCTVLAPILCLAGIVLYVWERRDARAKTQR